jgi:creatinine amidohydrolase
MSQLAKMGRAAGTTIAAMICLIPAIWAQQPASGALPVRYEELTALEFIQAVQKSSSVALIPMGILEKHGPHLPLGTDLLDVREVSLRAAAQEYCLVYPPYYFGQIFEAKHQPGTIAYSQELIWQMLQETCDELARNGIRKMILVNGHGGNNSFIRYFCQAQLAKKRDYAVFIFDPIGDPDTEAKIKAMRKTTLDGHAGEEETSTIMVHRPDLAHKERAGLQSGADQKRLDHLHDAYTAIWWYARYPNHYAGDGSAGNRELGEMAIKAYASQLAKMIGEIKKDQKVLELQNQFFKESENPLSTKQ